MAKGYRVEKPEPEFYFHFELGRPISEREWDKVEGDLRRIAQAAFKEHFPESDISFEFEIDLEGGSIRGRIRATGKVVKQILVWLALLGGAHQAGKLVWDCSTDALTEVRTHVEQYFASTHGIQDTIRTERRRGAVARLDRLINEYQQGQITYDEYMAEATAVLEKINESPDRAEIIPALREYMDAHQVNWQALAGHIPSVPREPQLPKDQRSRPDAALLDNQRRRELQGEVPRE
jgi:hypothetical protein